MNLWRKKAKEVKVQVVLGSWFKRYTEGKTVFDLTIYETASTREVLGTLKVPVNEVGFVTINNVKQDIDCVLKENDIARIYPHIIGG